MNKTCTRCGSTHSPDMFHKRAASPDGIAHACKPCAKKLDSMKHFKNRDARLSRMRVYSKTPEAKKAHAESIQRWQAENQKQRAANTALGNAVRDGKVFKTACMICGETKAEGHHADYDRPLDVIWLCTKHHKAAHAPITSIFFTLQ